MPRPETKIMTEENVSPETDMADVAIENYDQAEVAPRAMEWPDNIPEEWALEFKGLDPAELRVQQKQLVSGNGWQIHNPTIAERGPGLAYITDCFEPPHGPNQVESLLPLPDHRALEVQLNGEDMDLVGDDLIKFFDNRHNVLYVIGTFQDKSGEKKVQFTTTQYLDINNPRQSLQRLTLKPAFSGGQISIKSGINGLPRAPEYDCYSATKTDTLSESTDGILYEGKTLGGNFVAIGKRAVVTVGDTASPQYASELGERQAWQSYTVNAVEGQVIRADIVSSTQINKYSLDPVADVRASLTTMPDFDDCLARQKETWEKQWRQVDLAVKGDPEVERGLIFNLSRLMSATRPDAAWPGIGAKIGNEFRKGYNGHVFWDMDIFTLPALSRELQRAYLVSRYQQLETARQRAAENGHKGARFAWEATPNGEACPKELINAAGEVQEVMTYKQAIHISADVAYAVLKYVQETEDLEFLKQQGAEIVVEAARFLASCATQRNDGSYVFEHTTGPDEYHEDVTNEAYTLLMAAYTLKQAKNILASGVIDGKTLMEKIGLTQEEFDHMLQVEDKLTIPFDPANLVITPFEGWDKLEHVDLADYPGINQMDALWQRKHPVPAGKPKDELTHQEINPISKTDVIKQHAVVLALVLLGDHILDVLPEADVAQLRNSGKYENDKVIVRAIFKANFEKYAPQTCDGSSLSPSTWVLAALESGVEPDKVYPIYRKLVLMDLGENTHKTEDGLHTANAGSSIWAFVEGFMGIKYDSGELVINPRLPSAWSEASCTVNYHGKLLKISAFRETNSINVQVVDKEGPENFALPIRVNGKQHLLTNEDLGVKVDSQESSAFALAT